MKTGYCRGEEQEVVGKPVEGDESIWRWGDQTGTAISIFTPLPLYAALVGEIAREDEMGSRSLSSSFEGGLLSVGDYSVGLT